MEVSSEAGVVLGVGVTVDDGEFEADDGFVLFLELVERVAAAGDLDRVEVTRGIELDDICRCRSCPGTFTRSPFPPSLFDCPSLSPASGVLK